MGLVIPAIDGGARIRTEDLLRAKQALSQLSYTPPEEFKVPSSEFEVSMHWNFELRTMNFELRIRLVGAPGLEPGTSALSGLRSNQLSYAPMVEF